MIGERSSPARASPDAGVGLLPSSRILALATVLTLLVGGAPFAEDRAKAETWKLLHCGVLLAVPGEDPRRNVSLVIRGERIERIVAGRLEPAEVGAGEGVEISVIDLSGHFVLPGLIDAHTHISMQLSPESYRRRLQRSDAEAALDATVWARRTLEAGFTTIRDLGSQGRAAFALRDAIRAGKLTGPRILVAGNAISPTGGHGDRTLGLREDLFSPPGPEQGIADGPDACRRAVRTQVKRGADLIKLTATGGVLSQTAAGTEQQFLDDELAALVQTAHLLGRKVAAHAHGPKGINAALRAGVDSIEHGTFLDEESLELFESGHAYLVPTLLAAETVAEHAHVPGYFPPEVAEKALKVGPAAREAFRRALEAEVPIAFGTDAGVSTHGENAREFAIMVAEGMKPMDAIVAATRNGAELLGLADVLGTLEPGKLADLIATRGNPLVDIRELERIDFVMRGGVVVEAAR